MSTLKMALEISQSTAQIFASLPLYSRLLRSNRICNTSTDASPKVLCCSDSRTPIHFICPKNEVYGVVALIHLSVVGDMKERVDHRLFIDGGVSVIHALKSLKEKRVFKSPSSVELLEVRIVSSHHPLPLTSRHKRVIVNAESRYKKNMSENEVWDLLFPSDDVLRFPEENPLPLTI